MCLIRHTPTRKLYIVKVLLDRSSQIVSFAASLVGYADACFSAHVDVAGIPPGRPEGARRSQGGPRKPPGSPQKAPESPRETPGIPQEPAGGPRRLQEAPGQTPTPASLRRPQEVSGGAREAPASPQESPGSPQEAPGGPRKSPGSLAKLPGGPQEAPRRVPEAIFTSKTLKKLVKPMEITKKDPRRPPWLNPGSRVPR